MIMIPYGRQDIQQTDIDAVISVLQSDFLTQGPQVPQFEQVVAAYCNVQYAVAVNSATSALHIACLALGLGENDILWTSPITFVASANCALYCGASIDFVDIDPKTYNLCPEALEKKLIKAEREGKLPKIVVPVHLAGQPCDMIKIYELSKSYGFKIIEDASHAIGATYCDEPVGNCQYSDITIFSFHPVKIITTGEGGMAVTNQANLAEKMELLRSHGITRDAAKMTHEPDGAWYYQQTELGYNYRMTDMQAALGISQIKRLDDYIKTRHEIAERYNQELQELPLILPYQSHKGSSAYHLYIVRFSTDRLIKNKKQIFDKLRESGIGINVHYIPVHTQPFYQKMGFKHGDFPEAEKYYREAISLPIFPRLENQNIMKVKNELTECLEYIYE